MRMNRERELKMGLVHSAAKHHKKAEPETAKELGAGVLHIISQKRGKEGAKDNAP